MKSTNLKPALPVDTCKEVVLKIISQLPAEEFCAVAEEVQLLARKRSFTLLKQMRRSIKRGGLRKHDFTEALRMVRAQKRKKRDTRCS